MIFELFRDGAKNPSENYSRLEIDNLRESFSDLTTTGIKQHYKLGILISNKYPSLFGKDFSFNQVGVYTSSLFNTNMSAQAHMIGLGNNSKVREIETNNNQSSWMPPNSSVIYEGPTLSALSINSISFRSQDESHNYMFNSDNLCPNLITKINENVAKNEEKYKEKVKPSFLVFEKNGYYAKEYSNEDSWNLKNSSIFAEVLLSKIWNDSSFIWNYELLYHASFIRSFALNFRYSDPDINKTLTTKIFENWLLNIESLKDTLIKTNPKPKLGYFYSGHDSTLILLINHLLNQQNLECLSQSYFCLVRRMHISNKSEYEGAMDDMKQTDCFNIVPFASNLIVEIFSKENPEETWSDGASIRSKDLYVKLIFQNNNEKVKEMSLNDFENLLKEGIDNNFIENCGAKDIQDKNPQSQIKVVVIIFLIFAIISLILLIVGFIIQPKQKKTVYIHREDSLPIMMPTQKEDLSPSDNGTLNS